MIDISPQKSITKSIDKGISSQIDIVDVDSKDIPIYSDIPKRYKLGYHQFEVLFPLITEYDKVSTSFGSFNKKEVFIEFSTYREFILNNFEHEFQHVIYGDESLYEHASSLGTIFNSLTLHIENATGKGVSLSTSDIYSTLTPKFKKSLGTIIQNQRRHLTELWQSFILNVALLNIKSVILCGEYADTKLKHNSKQVVPIKFIPKLGSELDILFSVNMWTLDELKTKIKQGTLLSPYGRNTYISSLPSVQISKLLDSNLEGEPIYVPDIAEKYGYTKKRYEDAEHVIRTRATKTEKELESCELYLDEIIDFIDALGTLYSELKFINQQGNCIVTDFNCIEDYLFKR